MTSTSKTIPPRASKTAADLQAALTKALEAHPECEGISVVKLLTLEEDQGLSNWDAEFAAKAGTTISPECKRALLAAKQSVQKRFDLAVTRG